MLPYSNSLLDEVVQILRQVRGQALGLEDPQDLVSSDEAHLGNTMRVPKDHTWRENSNRHLRHLSLLQKEAFFLEESLLATFFTSAIISMGVSSCMAWLIRWTTLVSSSSWILVRVCTLTSATGKTLPDCSISSLARWERDTSPAEAFLLVGSVPHSVGRFQKAMTYPHTVRTNG
uniref:Uncharacterized protein n=1 Tax=Oncorhynchus kisutch TaxID=8019 RepID=A0A8C7CLT5_ONCKI